MKTKLSFFILLCAFSFTGCFTTQETDTSDLLVNCWTHSHEEDAQDGKQIFRPCDFKSFGPSHYRNKLVLKANQNAEYLELSPTDAHTMQPGKWVYDAKSKILRIMNAAGTVISTFTVISIESDKLLLQPA